MRSGAISRHGTVGVAGEWLCLWHFWLIWHVENFPLGWHEVTHSAGCCVCLGPWEIQLKLDLKQRDATFVCPGAHK